MKRIQFLLILFLPPNLPLFQTDRVIGINGLICEDAVVTKPEKDGPSIDHNLWFDLKLPSYYVDQVKFFFQLKSPLSFLLSRFQGVSPFWRSPPCL